MLRCARYWPDSTCKNGNKESRGWVQVSEDGGIGFRVTCFAVLFTRGSRMLPLIECKREPLEKSEGSHFRAQGDAWFDLLAKHASSHGPRVDRNESVNETVRFPGILATTWCSTIINTTRCSGNGPRLITLAGMWKCYWKRIFEELIGFHKSYTEFN